MAVSLPGVGRGCRDGSLSAWSQERLPRWQSLCLESGDGHAPNSRRPAGGGGVGVRRASAGAAGAQKAGEGFAARGLREGIAAGCARSGYRAPSRRRRLLKRARGVPVSSLSGTPPPPLTLTRRNMPSPGVNLTAAARARCQCRIYFTHPFYVK